MYERLSDVLSATIKYILTKGSRNKFGKEIPQYIKEHIDNVGFFLTGYDADKADEAPTVWSQDGDKIEVGRSVVKNPLTTLHFGASVDNAADSIISNGTLYEAIYDRIENLATLPQGRQENERKLIIKHLNNLSRGGKLDPLFRTNATVDELLNTYISDVKLGYIAKNFSRGFGGALTDTMKSHYAGMLGTRDDLLAVSNIAYDVFNSIYETERALMIERLMDEKFIPFTHKTIKGKSVRVPDYGLSTKQEQILLERVVSIIPVAETYFSKTSKQPESGLFVGKKATSSEPQGQKYESVVEFSPKATGFKSSKVATGSSGYLEPGVRMLVIMVHSSDSAISSFATEKLAALNIHDANATSLELALKSGKALNQGTFNVMANYSLPLEMMAMMDRVVEGYLTYNSDIRENPKMLEDLASSLGQRAQKIRKKSDGAPGFTDSQLLFIQIRNAYRSAVAAERIKLQTLRKVKVINQYAIVEGEYALTEADYALIDKKLLELKDIEAGVDKKLDNVQNFLNDAYAAFPKRSTAIEDVLDTTSVVNIQAAVSQWIANERTTAKENNVSLSSETGIGKRIRILSRINNKLTTNNDLDQVLLAELKTDEKVKTVRKQLIDIVEGQTDKAEIAVTIDKNTFRYILGNLIDHYRGKGSEIDAPLYNDFEALYEFLNADRRRTLNQAALRVPLNTSMARVRVAVSRHYHADRETPVGRLGKSSIESTPRIVRLLNRPGPTTIQKLVGALRGDFHETIRTERRGDRPNSPAIQVALHQQALLNRIVLLLSKDVKIEYIQKDIREIPKGLDKKDIHESSAWTTLENNTLYIKSPDFEHSAITPEMVLHELLHLTLAQAIDAAQKGKGTPEAKALVKDLEALRKTAQAHVENPDSDLTDYERDTFQSATSNVHELISYGLTDAKFQQKVLLQIEGNVSEDSKGVLAAIDGLKVLLNHIKQFFFPNSPKNSGVDIVLSHTMGLFETLRKNTEKQVSDTENSPTNLTPLSHKPGSPTQAAKILTNDEVFDRLANPDKPLDSTFVEHLKAVMNQIVNNLHGPMGSKASIYRDETATSAMDRYTEAKVTGELPFVSEAIGAGIQLSEQQGFVLEQVEQVVRAAMELNPSVRNEIRRTFEDARKNLKATDLQHDGLTLDEAQALYDFTFYPQRGPDADIPAFLSRFVALSLTQQTLNTALEIPTPVVDKSFRGKTFSEVVRDIFSAIVEFLNSKLVHTRPGESVNDRIELLVKQLVHTEARYRADATKLNKVQDALESIANSASEGARQKMEAFAKSKIFTQSRFNVVRATAQAAATVAGNRVEDALDHGKIVRDNLFSDGKLGTREGIIAATISDIRGSKPSTLVFHKLLSLAKHIGQERKNLKTVIAKHVLGSFGVKTDGEVLARIEQESLTKTVIRLDLSILLGNPESGTGIGSLADLANLVGNSTARNKVIAQLQAEITKVGVHPDYMNRMARMLGHVIATGETKTKNSMQNAHNIVMLHGVDHIGKPRLKRKQLC